MPHSAQPAKAESRPRIVESSGAQRIIHLPGPFPMHRGGTLPEVQIAYETWGTLSPEHDNAVVLFTGLSPGTHACSSKADPSPGWWEYMIGSGKPIDTDRFFVLCINSLGSCFGSTGPASVNPETGRPYQLDFPALTVEDIAAAARRAIRALGIRGRCNLVGASLGGMTALTYAIMYPEEVQDLVIISAATRARPLAIAMRSLQREIIRNDPSWKGGYYDAQDRPNQGMRMARKLGLLSYRSAMEWEQRFARERVDHSGSGWQEPFGIEFQVESYLEHHANKFIDSGFDPNSYLYLSRAMDWFDISEYGGSVDVALGKIQARRTLVLGVESDILFPIDQQREIADVLTEHGRDVRLVALPSVQGHDSFLVDRERFAPVVAEFFSTP